MLFPIVIYADAHSIAFFKASEPKTVCEDTESCLPLAQKGNLDAQWMLGQIYTVLPWSADYKRGLYWYQQAVAKEHAPSERRLCYMYERGLGVHRDYKLAFSWCKKAAEHGEPGAQLALAGMYDYGIGTQQDYKQALYWYKKIADQGDPFAQRSVAELYYHGYGVPQDYSIAFDWFKKAASQGDDVAQRMLGFMYILKFGVLTDYVKGVAWLSAGMASKNYVYVSDEQKSVFEWLKTSAYKEMKEVEKKQAKNLSKMYVDKYTDISEYSK